MDTSILLVADHFRVSHIPAATIPGSRLSNILAQMQEGHRLTSLALGFLQRQELPGLYRLACKEITYEAYIADLDTEQLRRNQAAMAALKAKESERQELASHHRAARPKYNATRDDPDSANPRELRRKRVREESEAVLRAQREYQAKCKLQRERNSELAARAFEARANTPDFIAPTAQDIARHFHLTCVEAAFRPPTSEVLAALFRGRSLTTDELDHVRHTLPEEVYRLAFGALTLDAYNESARANEAEATERKARRDAIEAARIARESDPEYIALMQSQALYGKYGVSLNDNSLAPRMTNLLQQIDVGNRLPKEDLKWLGTEAKKHFTPQLRETYHRLEADYHADEYGRTHDPWHAINASGHYRRCNRSRVALDLLDGLPSDRLNHPKVRSAVLTTRGGVMRDLGRRSEAVQLGEEAHKLMPKDYRPCTLLGAVHMELREFERGHEWYERARVRGAPENGIDSELRSIYQQMDLPGREEMKRFLLAEDAQRYRWLETIGHQSASKLPRR